MKVVGSLPQEQLLERLQLCSAEGFTISGTRTGENNLKIYFSLVLGNGFRTSPFFYARVGSYFISASVKAFTVDDWRKKSVSIRQACQRKSHAFLWHGKKAADTPKTTWSLTEPLF
jgi:hypothetical protein